MKFLRIPALGAALALSLVLAGSPASAHDPIEHWPVQIQVDPREVRHDYQVTANNQQAVKIMAPVQVFRDATRTFVDFGPDLVPPENLTAFLEDEPVWQEFQHQRRILVIQGVGEITLKSGDEQIFLTPAP